VRSIHKMPFITSLESRHGLPLPSGRLGRGGIRGEMTDHCSSVKSMIFCERNIRKLLPIKDVDCKVNDD
jgi:hypothetical protein